MYHASCKQMQHCWPTTHNIAGCYMLRPFARHVACCCMLLRVVPQSLKRFKILSQQLPRFLLLDPFAQLLQHCWSHARALHMVSKVLWVVSFPRCTAGPNSVWSCLHTTHQHCYNNSQYCRANNIGSSLLHSRFQCRHATLLPTNGC